MPPVDIEATVLANVRLSRDYSVLSLAAPAIGDATAPGQFMMVKAGRSTDPLLRRPFSVFEVLRDERGATTGVSLLNKRAGRSTDRLYHVDRGDVVSCLGPLGRPFTLPPAGTEAWMVAGGVGLAPFATLAEALASSGVPTTLFYGARTGAELFYLDFFERLGVHIVLSTEDGSRGLTGRVTTPLEEALRELKEGRKQGAAGTTSAVVYACGPEPMLAAVAGLAERYGQPSQVSVERVMGCGLGGCYSCVIKVRHGDEHAHLVRSCLNGPVFDGAELVWD